MDHDPHPKAAPQDLPPDSPPAGALGPAITRVLIDRTRIAQRVRELGHAVAADLASSQRAAPARIVLVPILTGSIVFVADLIRHMPLMLSLGVVAVSSYPGATLQSKGAMIRSALPDDLAGTHVLIVDDILDSGQTLSLVREVIAARKPASLRLCVLLRKPPEARKAHVHADYVGFEIPDVFVVGYGLDYDGYYRNHPDIGVLDPHAHSR